MMFTGITQNKIYLSLAQMSGHEQEFVKEAFDTNWVVPLGPNVDGFEEDLKSFLQTEKHVVALNSGTSAIHLALIQLGVSLGDEVLCQSFTFAASANPIIYQGATPVFIDSEADSWNMNPVLLELAIIERQKQTGKYPKAIIPVHLYGMPAKMDQIMEIAQKYGIPVIEDAAEALGSEYLGKKCGTWGDFGVLSFNGNKMITTSGGGALICKNKEVAEKTKFLATQARDKAVHYQHSQIGYNYRLSNISAGIGRGQMLALENFVNRRRAVHTYYKEHLQTIKQLSIMENPGSDFNSNFWLPCITIHRANDQVNRETLRIALDEKQIETRPLWKPLHSQPVFSSFPYYGNGTASHLFTKGLCLPSGATLSEKDLTRVVTTIQDFFNEFKIK